MPEDRLNLGDLGILGSIRVRVGSVNLTRALRSIVTKSHVNQLSTAEVQIEKDDPAVASVDFTGRVTVDRKTESGLARVFTGSVMTVDSVDGALRLDCMSTPELQELKSSGIQYSDNARVDVIYGILRSAGIPHERTDIEGMGDREPELFEIATPILGVKQTGVAKVGSVTFMPAGSLDIAAWYPGASEQMLAEFETSDALAVHYLPARILYDAERGGLAALDATMAWLVIRAMNSSASGPDGEIRTWARRLMLARPRRRRIVSVRGVSTGRRWVRYVDNATVEADLELESVRQPPFPDRISQTLQLSLGAAERAATLVEPLSRVTALWEAIEHYVGGTSVPALFSAEELRSIKAALPKDFTAEKRGRLGELIAQLNNPPLLPRLRHRLAMDGVPISEDEVDLLWRLRSVRNAVVHGRASQPPEDSEIQYGVAILSRILTAWVFREITAGLRQA